MLNLFVECLTSDKHLNPHLNIGRSDSSISIPFSLIEDDDDNDDDDASLMPKRLLLSGKFRMQPMRCSVEEWKGEERGVEGRGEVRRTN